LQQDFGDDSEGTLRTDEDVLHRIARDVFNAFIAQGDDFSVRQERFSGCDQGRGRQSEVAAVIGTTRQAINHRFAGRQQPTSEQILAVQEFLAKQKRRSKQQA
jgi:hypothetical protein